MNFFSQISQWFLIALNDQIAQSEKLKVEKKKQKKNLHENKEVCGAFWSKRFAVETRDAKVLDLL